MGPHQTPLRMVRLGVLLLWFSVASSGCGNRVVESGPPTRAADVYAQLRLEERDLNARPHDEDERVQLLLRYALALSAHARHAESKEERAEATCLAAKICDNLKNFTGERWPGELGTSILRSGVGDCEREDVDRAVSWAEGYAYDGVRAADGLLDELRKGEAPYLREAAWLATARLRIERGDTAGARAAFQELRKLACEGPHAADRDAIGFEVEHLVPGATFALPFAAETEKVRRYFVFVDGRCGACRTIIDELRTSGKALEEAGIRPVIVLFGPVDAASYFGDLPAPYDVLRAPPATNADKLVGGRVPRMFLVSRDDTVELVDERIAGVLAKLGPEPAK